MLRHSASHANAMTRRIEGRAFTLSPLVFAFSADFFAIFAVKVFSGRKHEEKR